MEHLDIDENGMVTGIRRDAAFKESLTTALDENGLARCGCGGEPKMLDIKRPYADKGFWVECQGCGITIGPCDSPTIAIIAFNQAMGVKGAG